MAFKYLLQQHKRKTYFKYLMCQTVNKVDVFIKKN